MTRREILEISGAFALSLSVIAIVVLAAGEVIDRELDSQEKQNKEWAQSPQSKDWGERK